MILDINMLWNNHGKLDFEIVWYNSDYRNKLYLDPSGYQTNQPGCSSSCWPHMMPDLQPCTLPLPNWVQPIYVSSYTKKLLVIQYSRSLLMCFSKWMDSLPNMHRWSLKASLPSRICNTIHTEKCHWGISTHAFPPSIQLGRPNHHLNKWVNYITHIRSCFHQVHDWTHKMLVNSSFHYFPWSGILLPRVTC